MTVMLRTVIIDSDPESRGLLRKTLATTPSVVVVSEYAETRQAAGDLPARRPDLVIVEVPTPPRTERSKPSTSSRTCCPMPPFSPPGRPPRPNSSSRSSGPAPSSSSPARSSVGTC